MFSMIKDNGTLNEALEVLGSSILSTLDKVCRLEIHYSSYLHELNLGNRRFAECSSLRKTIGVCNFLRSRFYNNHYWMVATARAIDVKFVDYMKNMDIELFQWTMGKEEALDGRNEIMRLAVITEAYLAPFNHNYIWAGFANTLSEIMEEVNKSGINNRQELHKIAVNLIASNQDVLLCLIAGKIIRLLKKTEDSGHPFANAAAGALSEDLPELISVFFEDMGVEPGFLGLSDVIKEKMYSYFEYHMSQFSSGVMEVCCDAFAEFIYFNL